MITTTNGPESRFARFSIKGIEFVAIANELFRKFHIAPVRDLSECDPSSFVTLYEGVLGDRLHDVIRSPVTREDEIHNVQCVIDSLSRDVLHCDLSHITGTAVVDRDPITVQYLLEILEGLVDYVMEQIGGSETSSELEDFKTLPEVSSQSETGYSGRKKKSQSKTTTRMVRTRSIESVSLPSIISPLPDTDGLSEGSNSTAELIRLGEESASYRTSHTGKHNRDENAAHPRSGLSKMFDSYNLSEGPLSQLNDTTIRDTSAQEPMSGSFSTITWPKAPSTMSSPSPVSKPATTHSISRPRHTKTHMAERLPPYNSLLGSLMDDYSDLAESSGHQNAETGQSKRRSLRLNSPPSTVTSAQLQGTRTPQQRSATTAPGYSKSRPSSKPGSATRSDGTTRRRSPRFVNPSARQAPQVSLTTPSQRVTPQDNGSRVQAAGPLADPVSRHAHSPPVRGSPASLAYKTRSVSASTYPRSLPIHHGSPATSRSSPLPHQGISSLGQRRHPERSKFPDQASSDRGYMNQQGMSSKKDQERYPALLPPYTRTMTSSVSKGGDGQSPGVGSRLRRSTRGSLEEPSADVFSRSRDSSEVASRLRGSLDGPSAAVSKGSRDSPGVASRMRESTRGSFDQPSADIRGRMEKSSSIADMEDSYDRSFMTRKVARRRRVAFEDEQSNPDPDDHPAQRFRYSRESDDENDETLMPDDHHYLPDEYARRQGRENETRNDSEEEEKEDRHSYYLRNRKTSEPKGKLKRNNENGQRPKQRSVLLPRNVTQKREPMNVCFEDAMNRDAKGLLGKVRRQLAEEAAHQSKMKNVLQHSYADNLREVKKGVKRQVTHRKKVEKQLDEEYKAMHRQPNATQYKPSKKYAVSVGRAEGSERNARSTKRSPPANRKRAASASPTGSMLGGERPLRIGDDDLLPTLMHEFPFVHISPHTAKRMWNQQMKHMEHLTKAAISHKYKKPKTQYKIEEAERKQEILANIMKKELAHNQRMRDIKERRNQERALQAKAKEQRQVNARARRYYDEYRVRAKSRSLKRRTKEEQIFKHLFEEGMAIQKARISELRKYAKEKRQDYTKQQQNEVESLENYYRDQFNMLAETIAKERHDMNVRDRAQANAMQRIKSDMRRKMEKEIREYQEELYRDEDAEYFRELEAERMKHELQIAKYKALL